MNTSSYKDMKMKISMIGRLKNVLLGAALALFAVSNAVAQDDSISITPTYLHFADTVNSQQSTTATITLTNSGYSSGVAVGTIALGGPHDFNFNLSNDNCSAQSLAQNSSCTLQVTFVPASTGGNAGISAWVSVPYGNDGNLSVYLSNQEDTEHEVQRRLPPVMVDLNIPEEMNAGTSYNLDWTAMGYHSGYKTVAVMFDCTDIGEGEECGGSYTDPEKFYESEFLTPAQITESDWSYSGERAQNFRYDYTFDVNATRHDGVDGDWNANGTPIVIRFYISSDDDILAGKKSLSLIIPGNLSDDYHDTSGRKIQKIICPSGGCSNP